MCKATFGSALWCCSRRRAWATRPVAVGQPDVALSLGAGFVLATGLGGGDGGLVGDGTDDCVTRGLGGVVF
jgi:hypothetical protein